MSRYMSPEDLTKELMSAMKKYFGKFVTRETLDDMDTEWNCVIGALKSEGKLPEGVRANLVIDDPFCRNIRISFEPKHWEPAGYVEEIPPIPTQEVENMNNIVIIVHRGDTRQYLFSVPEGVQLHRGEPVLVRTRRGERFGTCDCDSFMAADDLLQALATKFSATLPLKPVVGRADVVRFDGDAPYEGGSNKLLKAELEGVRNENDRLRREVERLHRENFWLTQGRTPTCSDYGNNRKEEAQ